MFKAHTESVKIAGRNNKAISILIKTKFKSIMLLQYLANLKPSPQQHLQVDSQVKTKYSQKFQRKLIIYDTKH